MSELMEIQSHKGAYTVEFDDACIERFAEWDLDKTHFIVDRKVVQLYPELLQPVLEAPSVFLLDAIETNKSLEKLPEYVEFLVNKNSTKPSAGCNWWRDYAGHYQFSGCDDTSWC